MDQFLERHNLPKLTQEETDNLKRAVSIKEIESGPKQEVPGPDGFTGGFYQTFRKKLYQFSTISFRI